MKPLALITATIILAVAAAIITQNPDERYVKTHECMQIYRVEGKKIYCGKACWKDADLVTYKCSSDNSKRNVLEAR